MKISENIIIQERILKKIEIEAEQRNNNLTLEEIVNTSCQYCTNKHCLHKGAFRRLPQKVGGLGLCENLE